MKILIDGRLYGLENAGLGRYVINLVRELAKIDSKNDYVLLLRKKYFNKLNLPKNWKIVLSDYQHYSVIEQIKLPILIKKEKPDIVHFPHFNVPIFFSGKFVVTIHDMLMHNFAGLSATTLPAPFYLLKYLVYKLVFRKAIYASLKIIVPSNAIKKEIIDYYHISSDKITVTYEGFDRRIGLKPIKINAPYFVYVGNAYPHKNLNRLIEAVILLNKNIKMKVLLVIASSRNVFTQKLSDRIKKIGAENFVKLLGFVPDSQLGNLYKNSIGFVFPSLSEGFGLPGLEALNAGTLLLASNTPIFKEIYGKTALYFDPTDPLSIEKSMRSALEIKGLKRKEKIIIGQKFVKKYSWVKMAEETKEIYAQSGNSLR